MKKAEKVYAWLFVLVMVAAVCTLVVLLVPAKACPETRQGAGYVEYTGESVWALVGENHELAGMLKPGEDVPAWPVQDVKGDNVRGFLENGMVRVPCKIRLLCVGEALLGLKKLDNVLFSVDESYVEIVGGIVASTLGEDAELSAGSISLCLLNGEEGAVATRFFPSWTDHFTVGIITFNNKREDVAALAVGDWDGDGALELGIPVGWTLPEPEPEPEQTPEPEKVCESEQKPENTEKNCGNTNAQPVKQDCWKLEVHWNFDLLLKHCKKLFGM